MVISTWVEAPQKIDFLAQKCWFLCNTNSNYFCHGNKSIKLDKNKALARNFVWGLSETLKTLRHRCLLYSVTTVEPYIDKKNL